MINSDLKDKILAKLKANNVKLDEFTEDQKLRIIKTYAAVIYIEEE